MIPLRKIALLNGPYLNKWDRLDVKVIYEDGTRRTIPYARHLMEQKLGRQLHPDETVDHINGNKLDDRIENLQLLSREDNLRKRHAEYGGPKMWHGPCAQCGATFSKQLTQVRAALDGTTAGPFCTRRCARLYQHAAKRADV